MARGREPSHAGILMSSLCLVSNIASLLAPATSLRTTGCVVQRRGDSASRCCLRAMPMRLD